MPESDSEDGDLDVNSNEKSRYVLVLMLKSGLYR